MNKTQELGQRGYTKGLGIRVIAGFLSVLILMASVTFIGLRHMSEATQQLRVVTQNNNLKTELATVMQTALRERALSMHGFSIVTDPFARDEEIQRFNAYGALYIDARQRFEQLPVVPEERKILDIIRAKTKVTQPEVQKVAEMAIEGESQPIILEQMRNISMPMQREIAEQLNALVDLQRDQTAQALRKAETSYSQGRDLMFLLCLFAILVGATIGALVSRRVAYQTRQLATQALYDPLTGLANRCLFQHELQEQIEKSRREGTSFGVLLMDLDRFKEVNDTLGHNVGDELLREVGRRLTATIRVEDVAARLGGDEYVVLLRETVQQDMAVIAKKILNALERPFHWQNQSIDLAASLGMSLYPSQCEDAGGLIRCADIAMYAAKRSGKGYALYAFEQERVTRGDLSLKSELREAIQTNQLVLYYQPQFDHKTGRVAGLEALVRWQHPQRGFLPPDKFIGLAEEAGLIDALTRWVLKTALHTLAKLQSQGHPLTMAVNLSARNVQDVRLLEEVRTLLNATQIAPHQVTFEITESAVMANPNDGLKILTELDRMGVSLSIDDFGTGYSSLAYLKQLPVDELKIDKSFVLDMHENESDAVIVRSTIDLAHNLGLKVTAEGVETEEAWEQLSALGCDHSQGYFMAKPMPLEVLEQWLQQSQWAVTVPGAILKTG